MRKLNTWNEDWESEAIRRSVLRYRNRLRMKDWVKDFWTSWMQFPIRLGRAND